MDQSADPHAAPDSRPSAAPSAPGNAEGRKVVLSAKLCVSRQALSMQMNLATGSRRTKSAANDHQHAWRQWLVGQLRRKIHQAHASIPAPGEEMPAHAVYSEGARSAPSQPYAPISFWNALDPVEQDAFRSLAQERIFAGGARLMREGERADYVIVILQGRVKICAGGIGDEHIIARRGPGQLVGERAILQVSVRSATVVALEMLRALVMTTEDFAAFVSTHERVLAVVEGQIYERLTEGPVRYEHGYGPPVRGGPADHAAAGWDLDHPAGQLSLNGENCTIVFTDVVGFGSPERNDRHRRIIRREILEMTAASLKAIWSQCSCEDRGDGLLIVIPPNIPTGQVLEYLLIALPIALKRHNGTYAAAVRVQLRVALDVGPVTSDRMGVSGQVIINAARLLEAPRLKAAVAANHANLGIIVSDFIYQSAVKHEDVLSDPGAFSEIEVKVKEATLRGWMQLVNPTFPLPPQRAALSILRRPLSADRPAARFVIPGRGVGRHGPGRRRSGGTAVTKPAAHRGRGRCHRTANRPSSSSGRGSRAWLAGST